MFEARIDETVIMQTIAEEQPDENIENITTEKEDSIRSFTRANGDHMTIYKPKSRPFRVSYETNMSSLNYIFSMKSKNSISFQIDLNYHKDLFTKILNIEKDIKTSIPGIVDFDVYEEGYVSNIIDAESNRFQVWINRIKKDENDNFMNPVKIFLNDEIMYFESNESFFNYIRNKKGKFILDLFFEPLKNGSTNTWNLQPQIYSINFQKELINDMSISIFNNMMSFQERKEFCEGFITESLKNNDNKDKSIPYFQFSNLFFDFPTINMKEDFEKNLSNRVYEPKVWVGKKKRFDPTSNSKESVNIIANKEIELFVKNLTEVFNHFLPDFVAVLSKRKVKQNKKDNYSVALPITEHHVGAYDEDEEFIRDEEQPPLQLINIKQPWYAEDDVEKNRWENIPSNVNYKIQSPRIYINKLWLNEKGIHVTNKQLVLQMSFSKYFNIKPIDNYNTYTKSEYYQ